MSDRILDRLLAVLGEKDTAKLLQRSGGTRIFVPAQPEGSKLADIIGAEGARRMEREFGQGEIVLPMGTERGQAGRRKRAAALLADGRSIRDVALVCDLHRRTVERISARLRDERQMQLPFDRRSTGGNSR